MFPGISTVVRIYISSAGDIEPQDIYKSRVDNLLSESLMIEVPLHEQNGRPMAYSPGQEITMFHFAIDGSKFILPSRILSRVIDGVPLWEVALPPSDAIQRIQRRNYLRIPASLELSLKSLAKKNHFLARTLDVSGGGVAFTCKTDFRIDHGERLACWLAIPTKQGMEHASFIAKVVRVVPPKEEGEQQAISLMITEIRELDREKIIRYCFDRQVELRKKGVL
ncbi:flagellar brake protein [Ammoniphilus sp. YIM 78166]|uniref:flagellar brake protein n=1 Tax=Ammoniphilus sp. YIM 78166 TaxID=1644106 RepID=UPI0010705D77|nr:PilZ domain-containing protein [Ammoniphilus sp. YIM 78166]